MIITINSHIHISYIFPNCVYSYIQFIYRILLYLLRIVLLRICFDFTLKAPRWKIFCIILKYWRFAYYARQVSTCSHLPPSAICNSIQIIARNVISLSKFVTIRRFVWGKWFTYCVIVILQLLFYINISLIYVCSIIYFILL